MKTEMSNVSLKSQNQATPRKGRVMVVDDHPIVRQGLALLINQEADLLVCGEAEEATGAMHVLDSSKPDILIVTEREDKPLKYPPIFSGADVAVITKMDVAAVEFDLDAARRSIHAVRPGMQIFAVSTKTGSGIEEFLRFIEARVATAQSAAV